MALRAKLRKGSDIWYAVGTIRKRGKTVRVRQSLDTTTEEVARVRCTDLELRLTETGGMDGKRLRDVIDAYVRGNDRLGKTTLVYLGRFMRMWGDTYLFDFTEEMIDDYVDERLSEGVQGATVRRELNALGPLMRLAYRKRWLKVPMNIERPSDGEPRLRSLDDAEYEALTGNMKRRKTWELVAFLVLTGARLGEAVNLKWSDVYLDVDQPYLLLKTRKRKGGREESRAIPIGSKLMNVLSLVSKGFNMFVMSNGRVFKTWSSSATAGVAIKTMADDAGIDDFVPHDLRRTFATRLLQRGADVRVVADLLGHKTLDMVMRYAVPPQAMKAEAIERL